MHERMNDGRHVFWQLASAFDAKVLSQGFFGAMVCTIRLVTIHNNSLINRSLLIDL
jgi:hypothetical protein